MTCSFTADTEDTDDISTRLAPNQRGRRCGAHPRSADAGGASDRSGPDSRNPLDRRGDSRHRPGWPMDLDELERPRARRPQGRASRARERRRGRGAGVRQCGGLRQRWVGGVRRSMGRRGRIRRRHLLGYQGERGRPGRRIGRPGQRPSADRTVVRASPCSGDRSEPSPQHGRSAHPAPGAPGVQGSGSDPLHRNHDHQRERVRSARRRHARAPDRLHRHRLRDRQPRGGGADLPVGRGRGDRRHGVSAVRAQPHVAAHRRPAAPRMGSRVRCAHLGAVHAEVRRRTAGGDRRSTRDRRPRAHGGRPGRRTWTSAHAGPSAADVRARRESAGRLGVGR